MKALVAYDKDDYRFEPAYPVPECGPDDIIVKTEACGVCAGDNEDVVVISGAGTLGLGMISYTRMKNPKLLIVLDMQDKRLEKAKEFGADLVFNLGKCDVDKEIKALTDDYGCDYYRGNRPSFQCNPGIDNCLQAGTIRRVLCVSL